MNWNMSNKSYNKWKVGIRIGTIEGMGRVKVKQGA